MRIRVNSNEPITFQEFIEANGDGFCQSDKQEMESALETTGSFSGGGGSAIEFTLTRVS